MDLITLLTPSLAAFAALVAIGLGVQAFRQGRQIRRLEARMGAMGAAGTEASLKRLAELQDRMSTSSGMARGRLRQAGIVVGAIAAVALIVGGIWFLVIRGGGDDSTAGTTATTQTGSANGSTVNAPQDPCAGLQPVQDPATVRVTVFNASGIQGAANDKVWPMLAAAGYAKGRVDNPPDNLNDLDATAIQFVRPRDRRAACSVAKELNITAVGPLDGYTVQNVGGGSINVLVIVGQDLANR